jgi:hypothetical protein
MRTRVTSLYAGEAAVSCALAPELSAFRAELEPPET